MSTAPAPRTLDRPAAIPVVSVGNAWLVAGLLLSVILYYLIGLDQGATSLFGSDTHIHALAHDARHFLGFPCH